MFELSFDEIEKIGESNAIYGYPTKNGMIELTIEIKKIINIHKFKDIIGIDLGCGDGKLIDFFNKNIKKSYWSGIELSYTRIEFSKFKDNNCIIEGNLLDLSYRDYNFIYVNNICFDDKLTNELETKLQNEFSGILITTKDLCNKKLLHKSKLLNCKMIETNWIKKHRFSFYIIF